MAKKKATTAKQAMFDGFDEPRSSTAPPPASTPAVDPVPPPLNMPPDPPQRETPLVYVIDAHSLIYQVFHALPEMSSPTGQPVGAVHGFIRDVVDIRERHKPDYLFCAFDYSGDTFRHKIYPGYKADRDEMPADLRPQIGNIRRMLEAMNVPVLELDQFEADDILATIAQQCDERGWNCVLVSGDKDCRQLISDYVQVLNIRKNDFMDADKLMIEWGIRPDQVVDFQALVGDSVDKVPGVPLIGPKIAQELITRYGTLDEVLAKASEVAGKKRSENLVTYRDQALMSRELVQLVRDTPIEVDWEAGRVSGVNRAAVLALCQEFGFRRLADQLAALADEAKPAPAEWIATYRTIATESELQELITQMAQQTWLSVDTETTSTQPRGAEIVGYCFAWQAGEGYYVPVRAPAGEPQLSPDATRDALRDVLENPAIQKLGQNLKYDMVVLRSADIRLAGVAFDTMVADYLLAPGERNHNLDDLALRFLNHQNITIDTLIGTGKNQKRMDEVPVALITPYAAEDADVALRLKEILAVRLEEEKLSELFDTLEMPLIEVLAEMEFNGIAIDTARLAELGADFAQRIAVLEQEIYAMAGSEFNIDSRQQLGKILFEDLKLPAGKKTKTGLSTDVDVLEDLAKRHPLPAKIIEYRQFAKLKSTYVDALPQLVLPQTNRVHTSFKQDVAATGRLSSKDPNLQNIPIRTETGRQIRSAFIPGPAGWKLLTADYSQIELRVLAHFSGDEALRRAFAVNQDIHTLVASEVYGVPLDAVTREQRRSAKAINFGIIYGQSAFGLAAALDIDQDEAAKFIDAYFARYPGVEAFMNATLDECRKLGYVATISGRRRPVTGVRSAERRGTSRQKILPERIAINTVIQGSAADLIKQAMILVHRRLMREQLDAKLLLQIHDELIFEAPEGELSQLAQLVTEEMQAAGTEISVPLVVDVKTGDNWAECELWG
jgi:DNA polymerase-1